MKRFYSFMLSAVVAIAASAAAPRVATEVISPLPGGLNFQAAVEKTELASQFKANTPAKMNKREGVAELPYINPLRIEYFGRIRHFSRLVRIIDSEEVKNRLYNKKTAKIGLFRPIFVCFYAV